MKKENILLALLLIVAGLQTASAQGFRVYKSDGTIVQFSLHKDSIAIYSGGSDEDLGPFTPVNQCIVGTWYKSKSETVTFNEDGTTDYMEGATYEFLPYQGSIIIYHKGSDTPVNFLKVYKVTAEEMIVSTPGNNNFYVMTRTQPIVLVREIVLSETSLTLQPDELKTLTATVLPEDADNPAVTWESSDEEVAEVNKSGRVIANADGTCIITCRATDGSDVTAICSVVVNNTHGYTNGHEWVDLGLPSGTLWATCNVGAEKPEEYGDLFAWGETSPKSTYTWSNYIHCKGYENTLTKYCLFSDNGYNGFTDGKKVLDPTDDAATANWGDGWQMPSDNQIGELEYGYYTTSTWTTMNGVSGWIIVSKSNGKSLFMPYSSYWSRSLNWQTERCNYAFVLYVEPSAFFGNWNGYRYYGRRVRPVRVQTR